MFPSSSAILAEAISNENLDLSYGVRHENLNRLLWKFRPFIMKISTVRNKILTDSYENKSQLLAINYKVSHAYSKGFSCMLLLFIL